MVLASLIVAFVATFIWPMMNLWGGVKGGNMNRFGFCKQEGPVFRIRDLNSPWRSVLHQG